MKNPPIIRTGQRKPYVKGTSAQIDERRGYVARLLAKGLTKTQIHRAVRQRFNVEWRQCDRYIAFISGQQRGWEAWLPRVRAGHPQSVSDETLAKMKAAYANVRF
jgi:hypothetical protein